MAAAASAVYWWRRRQRRRQQRRRTVYEDAYDLPDELFRRLFRLDKEKVEWLCGELADELRGVRTSALSVRRQVLCALRFFASGGFQVCVGNEQTVGLAQPTVSKCVRRVAEAICKVGAQKGWVRFPAHPEEKAAAKATFLPRGTIPGVVGCVDGTLIAIKAPRGDPANRAAFWSRKGYYAMNTMIVSRLAF